MRVLATSPSKFSGLTRVVLVICLSLSVGFAAEARPTSKPSPWRRLSPADIYKRARLSKASRLGQPLVTKGNPVRALPKGRPDRLVVGVMGSAAKEKTIPKELKQRLWQLGKAIGKGGHVVLTGACPGMPQLTARAAHRNGGFTVGISPAKDLNEHTKRFRSPTKSLDVIQMTGAGAGMGLIAREKQNIRHSDILVFAGGRSGTLGEILFAMQEPKVIALLEDSTGVTSKTRSQILPLIGKGKGVVVSDRDPVKLMDKAVAAHKKLQARQPRQSTLQRLGLSLGKRVGRAKQQASRKVSKWMRRPLKMQRAPVITDEVTAKHNVYTFFGTKRGMKDVGVDKVMTLVKHLAADQTGGRKPMLVTPARHGLPSQVARAAKSLGMRTVGIAPAGSREQYNKRGKPKLGYDVIRLTGEGSGVGELAAYQHGIKKADVVFVAGGDDLTLGGTVFAMYQPTVVAVLKTGGMSGKLKSDILSTFNKPAHAKMIYDSDPVRLYNRAVKAAAKLRDQTKAEYVAAE